MQKTRGFTLVELVTVIVILSVLAALAVPRFVNMATTARIASLKSLSGTVWSTAVNLHALCKLDAICDYNNDNQTLTFNGKPMWVNYGWLDAGNNLGLNQIDAWVTFDGFTPSILDGSQTVFTLDSAPDPANCSVSYHEAYHQVPPIPRITMQTSGC